MRFGIEDYRRAGPLPTPEAQAHATCSSRHVASDARDLTGSGITTEWFVEYDAAPEVAEYTGLPDQVDANLSSTVFDQGRRTIYRY